MIAVSRVKSGVEIPKPGQLKKTKIQVYPWKLMKVGDSFQAECTTIREMDKLRHIITSSWGKAIKSGYGKKYTMRKMRNLDGEILVIRVWRIK